jgi:ATP-dependent helicase/nuclease subunit A
MNWTKEQQQVIDLRDRDILVSAAAGSGKTAVLVERIIKRITDEEKPVDIDRLLVVTFTKAAAAEMRERIGNAIEEQCEQSPMNAHLRRQSALIHNAMITTIDSFCLFVVRNHFEEIDLDPNFRIADEGEMKLLEQDVMGQVFEENYAEKSEDFLRLIDTYAGKRNDGSVRDMVSKIYRMSLSSPWPAEWIAGLAEPYQAEDAKALLQTPMIADIAENARLLLVDMRSRLEGLLSLCTAPDGPQAYAATLEADVQAFSGVEELSDYEAMAQFFAQLTFGKLSPIRKFEGDALKKDAVQSGRNAIKKEIDELRKKYFSMELEDLLAQIAIVRPHAQELVRLALQYTEAMAQAKRRKRIVDFSDIEHFALRILVDEETNSVRISRKS